jgi:hypothetical protein
MNIDHDLDNSIEIFYAQTVEFLECIVIPAIYKKELFVLMGWQAPKDELYGYHLSARQMKVIGTWVGRDLSSAHLLVQLVSESK